MASPSLLGPVAAHAQQAGKVPVIGVLGGAPATEAPRTLTFKRASDRHHIVASSVIPTLTTVHVDRVGMGRKIGDVLLQRINGERPASNKMDVGFQIRERESASHKLLQRLGKERTEAGSGLTFQVMSRFGIAGLEDSQANVKGGRSQGLGSCGGTFLNHRQGHAKGPLALHAKECSRGP